MMKAACLLSIVTLVGCLQPIPETHQGHDFFFLTIADSWVSFCDGHFPPIGFAEDGILVAMTPEVHEFLNESWAVSASSACETEYSLFFENGTVAAISPYGIVFYDYGYDYNYYSQPRSDGSWRIPIGNKSTEEMVLLPGESYSETHECNSSAWGACTTEWTRTYVNHGAFRAVSK